MDEWKELVATFFGAVGIVMGLGGVLVCFDTRAAGPVFVGLGALLLVGGFRLWLKAANASPKSLDEPPEVKKHT
jgi:hypothetical protein